jgi:hypothetical protein
MAINRGRNIRRAERNDEDKEREPRFAMPHETGVVEAEHLAGGAVLLVRVLGVGLWLVTLIGTYVPFVGGWAAFVAAPWPPSQMAAGIALAMQTALSWAQWSFKARAVLWWRARDRPGYAAVAAQTSLGWWAAYAIALLISAGFSAYTYGQWAAPVLESVGPWWAGLIIVGIGAIVVDMLPEWIFIRG